VRAKEVTIDRIVVDLVGRPEIMLDEEAGLELTEQANPARAAGKPAVLDIGSKDVAQIRRCGQSTRSSRKSRQDTVAINKQPQIAQRVRSVFGDHADNPSPRQAVVYYAAFCRAKSSEPGACRTDCSREAGIQR
jgi:hypothetical protein